MRQDSKESKSSKNLDTVFGSVSIGHTMSELYVSFFGWWLLNTARVGRADYSAFPTSTEKRLTSS
jgi:hypothetical protein